MWMRHCVGCLRRSAGLELPQLFASDSVQALHVQTTTGRHPVAKPMTNADMRAPRGAYSAATTTCVQCRTGRRRFAMVREDPPDLVLADVMMLELDGFAVLRELRAGELTSTIPVILLSARGLVKTLASKEWKLAPMTTWSKPLHSTRAPRAREWSSRPGPLTAGGGRTGAGPACRIGGSGRAEDR